MLEHVAWNLEKEEIRKKLVMEYNFVVTLSSKYEEIGKIFFELLFKNFPYEKKNIFVSSDTELELSFKADYTYINSEETLPTKICNIAKNNKKDYYICLLGDAFLCGAIDKEEIDKTFKLIEEGGYDYCNLIPKNNFLKNGKVIRNIKTNERYGVSFIAFVATYDFIVNEFGDNISDHDFETKYLLKAIHQKSKYLNEKAILKRNIFHICHGVSDGKWVRKSYKKVCNNGIEITNQIPVQGFKDSMKDTLFRVSSFLFPPKLRFKIKKLLIKIGFKFKTEY